jgi:hypothetical protein
VTFVAWGDFKSKTLNQIPHAEVFGWISNNEASSLHFCLGVNSPDLGFRLGLKSPTDCWVAATPNSRFPLVPTSLVKTGHNFSCDWLKKSAVAEKCRRNACV